MNELIIEVVPETLLVKVWHESVDDVNKTGSRELLAVCGLSGKRAEFLKKNPPTVSFVVKERE